MSAVARVCYGILKPVMRPGQHIKRLREVVLVVETQEQEQEQEQQGPLLGPGFGVHHPRLHGGAPFSWPPPALVTSMSGRSRGSFDFH